MHCGGPVLVMPAVLAHPLHLCLPASWPFLPLCCWCSARVQGVFAAPGVEASMQGEIGANSLKELRVGLAQLMRVQL